MKEGGKGKQFTIPSDFVATSKEAWTLKRCQIIYSFSLIIYLQNAQIAERCQGVRCSSAPSYLMTNMYIHVINVWGRAPKPGLPGANHLAIEI